LTCMAQVNSAQPAADEELRSGELAIVVDGAPPQRATAGEAVGGDLLALVDALVEGGCTTRTIADALAKATGVPRREAFALALRRQGGARGASRRVSPCSAAAPAPRAEQSALREIALIRD